MVAVKTDFEKRVKETEASVEAKMGSVLALAHAIGLS